MWLNSHWPLVRLPAGGEDLDDTLDDSLDHAVDDGLDDAIDDGDFGEDDDGNENVAPS